MYIVKINSLEQQFLVFFSDITIIKTKDIHSFVNKNGILMTWYNFKKFTNIIC